MENEKCKECKRVLVLDEENLCAYCELTQTRENGEENTLNNVNVNCGICKVIVEDDSEGLFCDVCNSWFHNKCNGTPLSYELYALLNDAPDNVKWFCDKCIWETEKWIKEMNSKHYQKSGEVVNSNNMTISNLEESDKENEVNEGGNDGDNENNMSISNLEESDKENEVVTERGNDGGNENINEGGRGEVTEEDDIDRSSVIPEIKIEIINEDLENEEIQNSSDSDEWVPTEEKEEILKIKKKRKWKKASENITCDKIDTISEIIVSENMSNILDVSPEKLSNITDGILTVKKPKHIRTKCNLCPKAFLHLEDCIAHKLSDHEGIQKPYKCPDCKITFDTKRHRNRHVEFKHSSEKKFSCDICAKTLKNNDSLRSHLKIFHSNENLHSCTECDYTTKYKSALTQHMINEHSIETQIQCKICCKYFVSDCYLKNHMAVHSSEKPFACDICSKQFATAKQRRYHMVRHVTEMLFECKECDKKCATKKLLKNHMLSHIPKEERPHACDKCDLRFNTKSNLKKHKEIHTGVLKAICDICGKGFRDTHYLKRHTMMHTDERPLKCEICGKGYRHSQQLDLHIKYHKKIVTARCPICGYGAPTKNILDRHIKLVHTNDTPFECDNCGNKYKTKGNLSKHKRGIRGSCKGFNTSDASILEKRDSKTSQSHRPYYEQNESKQKESSIPFQETSIATTRMPIMQNYDNHPSLLLYANSHNSNVYATQYHGSLIPPNSRGITAAIQTSPISY